MGPGTMSIAGALGAAAAAGAALTLFFKSRRKSAAEKERERRLKINAIGRICDASILEVTDSRGPGGKLALHLHYYYSVNGVTYTAAQDISALRALVETDKCSEGVPASIKYDAQNPSNSIILCELWSGLR